jgi:hypothetical protein
VVRRQGPRPATVVAMHVASQRVARTSALGQALEAELNAGRHPVALADRRPGVHGGAEGGREEIVVPLALPLAGALLQWLEGEIAAHPCGP